MEDVNTGIAWVLRNIGDHGGDVGRVFVVGHSAGAHLGSLTLFRQVGDGRPLQLPVYCKNTPGIFLVRY